MPMPVSTDRIIFAPAWELVNLIRAKELSPVEVVDCFLRRIDQWNPKLKAFITIAAEQAILAARKAEADVMHAADLPPLHGVPLAVKDTLFTRGIRTTGGSLVYERFVPEEDAVAVARLRQAGAIVLGKTTTPEFAMGGGLSYNRIIGDDCHNPWDYARTAGASSGGSAAAVAAGLAPMAIGSDAGGSNRNPAAWCGIIGLKQTTGRVPAYGGFESKPLFNVVGPLTRTVRDAALMLQAMAGHDPRDPFSLREKPPDFVAFLQRGVKDLKIAWSPDLGHVAVEPEIGVLTESAALRFQSLGCKVDLATPEIDDWRGAWLVISQADLYAGRGEALDSQPEKLTPVMKSIMEAGKGITGPEYARALWRIYRIRAQMAGFFDRYDLLLTPTVGIRPHKIQEVLRDYGKPGKALEALTAFTPLANVTGGPSATVPCGFTTDGLPVGLLITGRWGEDGTMLRACAAFEEVCPWANKTPPLL